MRLILIVILVVLVLALLPTWPFTSGLGWGYYPSGGLGIILLILIVLLLMDKR